ncbi:hypothetical protein CRE_03490 [Caenorhabditis remanei]|uniref:Reverse transcriptase domain-containing protein n=1 Tax=Caenorhabditis remanei TaxID=31234 RepID=E3NIA3_CAERE|nr:hypothetical protein CRE_03490 [Caenorhabditis remanei]
MQKDVGQMVIERTNKDLITEVGLLRKEIVDLKNSVDTSGTSNKKTFAEILSEGLAAPSAQVSFMSAAKLAQDADSRKCAVIVRNAQVSSDSSKDADFAKKIADQCKVSGKCQVFRIKTKSDQPPLLKLKFETMKDASTVMSSFHSVKTLVDGCREATVRPDLSKPELNQYRKSWAQAIQKNNAEGKRIWTVRNLEVFITVGYANCFSVKNKIPDLELLASSDCFDLFCLTETKLDQSFTNSLLSLNNQYSVVRKDRNKHGGGVAILISKNLKFLPIDIPSNFGSSEVVGLDVMVKGETIRVIVAYHPNHFAKLDNLIATLEFLLSSQKNCIFLGDFNMPHVDWSLLSACDSPCKHFLSFVVNNGLSQHVMSPTRLNPDNILDLCLTNTSIVRDVLVGDLFSDHKFIKVITKVRKETKNCSKMVKLFRKGDYDIINHFISRIDWRLKFSCMSVEEMYCSFTKIMHVLIARFVPTKSFKLSYKSHSLSVIKLQKEKLRIWRSEGNSTRYKEVSNLLKRRLRQEEKALHERCLENGNPKEFFNFINSRYKENSEIGVLKNKTNEPINDAFEKAEIFSECFSEVFTNDDNKFPTAKLRSNFETDSITFEPFAVEDALSKLASKVNTTPEGIPAIFLKNVCTSVAEPLSIIFNESVRTGSIPIAWKSAIVKPLHKKGSRSDANNYRPISLTSSVSKVIEKMMRKHLTNFLNSNRLLSPSQFGFRSGMSTESQLLVYQEKIITNCLSKLVTHSVYVDFKKAFDTVSIPKLQTKLRSYGIREKQLTAKLISPSMINYSQAQTKFEI